MGFIAPVVLVVFCLAYAFVFLEERLQLRKSKPVMVAAGLIWILVAVGFGLEGKGPEVTEHVEHVALEYAELLLFLLSAMSTRWWSVSSLMPCAPSSPLRKSPYAVFFGSPAWAPFCSRRLPIISPLPW
jgi:hypothetical protein